MQADTSVPVALLGPQRHAPDLRDAIDAAGISGKLAVVTAGWEEREDEDLELGQHLGGRAVNLGVFARAERIYERDHELRDAVIARHEQLDALQRLYRLRLAHALSAARELLALPGDDAALEAERDDAIAAVRQLDQRHGARVAEVHDEFEQRLRTAERDHVIAARAEIAERMAGTEALCIAGGHVGVLHNRMRLLDVTGLAGHRPVFAWSAGAMLLTEHIVLFHDSPPQGAGDAEVLTAGFGTAPGVVVLPHARHRLRVEDRTRVALMARRFAPALCVAFDGGARLQRSGDGWRASTGTRRLCADGTLTEVEAA